MDITDGGRILSKHVLRFAIVSVYTKLSDEAPRILWVVARQHKYWFLDHTLLGCLKPSIWGGSSTCSLINLSWKRHKSVLWGSVGQSAQIFVVKCLPFYCMKYPGLPMGLKSAH